MQMFFSMGDKVTRGDPVLKANFDYYFMWILFSAFVILSVTNWTRLFLTKDIGYLPWALIGLAISWFQYYALKTFYTKKVQIKELYDNPPNFEVSKDLEEDSVKDMMEEFK